MPRRPRPGAACALMTLALAGLLTAVPALASVAGEDIDFATLPEPDDLRSLTRELGVSLCPISLAPAEALGAWQVDLSAAATGTRIDRDAPFWRDASGGERQSTYLVFVTGRARLGLPLGIGVGVLYGNLPGTNVGTEGGELKWTFLRGGTLAPAMAVRASHVRMRGVDQMDLKATALDLSISKGLGFFTPYAGVGRIWLSSEIHDVPPDRSRHVRSSPGVNRVFGGARLTAAFFRTTVEAQRRRDPNVRPQARLRLPARSWCPRAVDHAKPGKRVPR